MLTYLMIAYLLKVKTAKTPQNIVVSKKNYCIKYVSFYLAISCNKIKDHWKRSIDIENASI